MKVVSSSEGRTQLSRLVAAAAKGEVQIITKNGKEIVAILSYHDYKRLKETERSINDCLPIDTVNEQERKPS